MTEPLVLRGPEGAITVAPAALERLVVQAAQSVDGARVRRPKRSVEVDHGDGRASVSFELAVERRVRSRSLRGPCRSALPKRSRRPPGSRSSASTSRVEEIA